MEVVGAVVEVILARVISLAAEHISVALGFKEELTMLHDSLIIIQALLQDADRRQEGDRAVKLWLEKLRDVAYEADDVLDEFAYDVLRRKVEIQSRLMKKECINISSLGQLRNLRFLEIDGMERVKCIYSSDIASHSSGWVEGITLFPSLRRFSLENMSSFEEWVQGVDLGTEGREDMVLFPQLEELFVLSCPKLKSVPIQRRLASLRAFNICYCDGLNNLKDGLSASRVLEKLRMSWCHSLVSVPKDIRELHSLVYLEISFCPKLSTIPEEILGHLTSLKELKIGFFSEELEEFPGLNSIHLLHASLEYLSLFGWQKLESLPPQLQHLAALKSFTIGFFDGMEALPEWLGNLTSLQTLRIAHCNNLMRLPSMEAMERLSKLQRLVIHRSSILAERCTKESGPEWHKIAHIPCIEIE
ncbi:hypothetical protein SCA6_016868 [Theobroma cacao]